MPGKRSKGDKADGPILLANLKEDPANPDENPRAIDEEAIEGLGVSMSEFGDISGLTYNRRTDALVTGHQRMLSLLERHGDALQVEMTGEDTFAVITPDEKRFPGRIVDWDADRAAAAGLAANSPLLQGGFTPGLGTILDRLRRNIPGLHRPLLLEGLRKLEPRAEATGGDGEVKPDDVPTAPPETAASPGELWILGSHRIICGDATDPETWERLMGGGSAAMVFTDPPYGVSYKGVDRKGGQILGDDLRGDALAKMLKSAFSLGLRHSVKKAAWYIWHATITREDFLYAMTAAGIEERQYIVWSKPMVPGNGDYQSDFEPCFYAGRCGEKPEFYADRSEKTTWRFAYAETERITLDIGPGVVLQDGAGGQILITAKVPAAKRFRRLRVENGAQIQILAGGADGTIWEVARDGDGSHPTQKPVDLGRKAILNSSRAGEVVVDPFLGSGSTLIGAEMTGRACYGMELDPGYLHVILERWARFTGEDPVREDGETWASVRAAQ